MLNCNARFFVRLKLLKCLINYITVIHHRHVHMYNYLRQILESFYSLFSLTGDAETVEGTLNAIEGCFHNTLVIQALRGNAMVVGRLRESLDALSAQSPSDSISTKASSLRDLIDGR